MKYVWITILVSVFITMTILIPVYVEKIEVSVSKPVSTSVETVVSDENPYPEPTEETPAPTLEPYPEPRPTQSFPLPKPVCHEYWFEGVFMGWMCVQP